VNPSSDTIHKTSTTRRRQRTIATAVALGAATLLVVSACSSGGGTGSSSGGGTGSPGSNTTVSFVNTKSVAQPGYITQNNGFFAKQGLDVKFTDLPTGTESIAAMIGGSTDFVLGGDTRLVQAAAKKLPVVAVGLAVTGYPSYLVVPASDKTTKSIDDLKGKKIAVEVGSSQDMGFVRYLQAAGLSPDMFQFVNLQNAAQPAALSSGSVAGAVFIDPFVHGVVDKGIGRIVLTPAQIAAKSGSQWPYMLLTTKQYAQKNADTVQKFVNAWTCAKEYMVKNPDQALTSTTKAFSDYDPKVVPYILDVFSYKTQEINASIQDDIKKQAQALVDTGTLKTIPDMTGYVDNSFVDKAIQTGCKS